MYIFSYIQYMIIFTDGAALTVPTLSPSDCGIPLYACQLEQGSGPPPTEL